MKPTTITLSTEHHRTRAAELLKDTPLDGKWLISFSNKKQSRTDQQRKYYFKCVGIMEDELGYDRGELHRQFLATKYLPLYLQSENEKKRTKYERIALKIGEAFEQGDTSWRNALIGSMITSNDATVQENATVIDKIVRQAAELNIMLPIPSQRGLY